MPTIGSFLGVNIGTTALVTSMDEQDIVGNNIANADNTGYSDESADVTSGPVSTVGLAGAAGGVGQFGNGVSVSTISRARDTYLDQSVRNAMSDAGTQSSASTGLTDVQNNIDEPSTSGISAAMTTFFSSLSDVQNNPEDTGVRTSAIGDAQALATDFNTTQTGLDTTKTQLQDQETGDLASVNSLASQIANLNAEISKSTALGQQPNTLMDQRDTALDSLSSLVNITTSAQADGSTNVSIGGTQIVSGNSSTTVTLAGLQATGDLKQGGLQGDVMALSGLATYQTSLDDLANEFMSQVNAIHEKGSGTDGSTGLALFTGTGARDMAVNSTIVADPNKLAVGVASTAGAAPASGDASNIEAIYNLKTTTISTGPLAGETMQGYYQNMVTNMGQLVSNANTLSTSATASVTQLTAQRSSISGVNLDQEMTNMIKYQRSYQAAAKVIQSNCDMLDSLISMIAG